MRPALHTTSFETRCKYKAGIGADVLCHSDASLLVGATILSERQEASALLESCIYKQ